MFNHSKNIVLQLKDSTMDIILFGQGKQVLIMIPGLGDGLKTVKGTAAAFAMMYRQYAKKYTVYVLSRKNNLPAEYSTREMASDIKEAMDLLKIEKADVLGVSQGGMIAQYLAIDFPEFVNKLVLTVTLSEPNDTVRNCIHDWIMFAQNGEYKKLMLDTADRTYSEKYLKKYRPLYALMAGFGRPKSYDRFITMAKSCVQHNSSDELKKIICEVLIIGGAEDKIVGKDSSRQLADRITNSQLYIYPGLGHGTFEEAKDYHDRVLNFL